jgi:hypothetical protein
VRHFYEERYWPHEVDERVFSSKETALARSLLETRSFEECKTLVEYAVREARGKTSISRTSVACASMRRRSQPPRRSGANGRRSRPTSGRRSRVPGSTTSTSGSAGRSLTGSAHVCRPTSSPP